MQVGKVAQSGHELLIIIVHENFDFARDISRALKRMKFRCTSVYRMDFSSIKEISNSSVMFVIDLEVNDRHLRLIERIVKSGFFQGRTFFVNAKRYEKGDWQKINTYCQMIAVQDRLWQASGQN